MNVAHLYAPPSPTRSEPRDPAPIAAPIPFTTFGVIGQGWRTFREQSLRLTLTMTVGLLVSFALGGALGFAGEWIAEHLDDTPRLLLGTVVPQAIGFVFGAWLSVGMFRIALAAARKESFAPSMLFSGLDATLPLIGVQLVSVFLVLCGTLCLIVPGIVLSVALSFASFIVIDRRCGVFEAITLSQRITRGRRAMLFGLALLTTLMQVIGVLALGVGWFVAFTVVQLVQAHAYLHLIGEPS